MPQNKLEAIRSCLFGSIIYLYIDNFSYYHSLKSIYHTQTVVSLLHDLIIKLAFHGPLPPPPAQPPPCHFYPPDTRPGIGTALKDGGLQPSAHRSVFPEALQHKEPLWAPTTSYFRPCKNRQHVCFKTVNNVRK